VKVLTSDEFARWFSALGERAAEDVAVAIEVIAELGTDKEPPGSSEFLTWYEHPSLSARLRELRELHGGVHPLAGPSGPLSRFIHEWGAFHGYARRVVKHLESQAFTARLGKLHPRDAEAVVGAVAHIRRVTTRRTLALSEYQVRRRLWARPPTPEEAARISAFGDVQEIREAYFAALAAAGFAVVDVPAHSPALREMAVREPPPGFRLLYGVDAPRERALVVFGEAFDRSYYGDSVRRAERLWQEFLHGKLPTTEAKAG
jgi:hypothetical protein